MNDDDIEILDLSNNPNLQKNNTSNNEVKEDVIIKRSDAKKKKVSDSDMSKKKKKLKKRPFQVIFCTLSGLFILGCCVFYGSRLIKYYKIYNPKGENGETIKFFSDYFGSTAKDFATEGSGLYMNEGNYIFKGEVDNNYLKFSNMLWRIVKVSKEGTFLVLDDYLNVLPWNSSITDYNSSDINNYLNDVLLSKLNQDLLSKNTYCADKVNSLSSITCNEKNSDNYVGLLDVTTFLNSIIEKKSYMVNDDEIFWLNNYGDEKGWHTNGTNVSQSDVNTFYEVKPVIVLKTTTPYVSGNGSKESPYLVEKESKEIKFGSVVSLDNDKWIVYENNNDEYRLVHYDNLSKMYRFDKEKTTFDVESVGSLAEYLNTTYLDVLSYKDMLKEVSWNAGIYKESYKDVKESSVKAKVGLPNLSDVKLINNENGYYLLTGKDEYVFAYDEVMKESKPSISRNIRPCIALSKDIKVSEGNGTSDSPFIVEVK